MLLTRTRHASVRSLERYACPGVDAVARHVAERDPEVRRRKHGRLKINYWRLLACLSDTPFILAQASAMAGSTGRSPACR